MAQKKNAPKQPPMSSDELIFKIAQAEKPLIALATQINAKSAEVNEFREAHPEREFAFSPFLGLLEEERAELYNQFRVEQEPITQLLAQLSQLDPTRFGQELRRIRAAGLQEPPKT